MGDEQATTEAFDAIVAAYKDSDDPQIASQARSLELNIKLPALLAGEEGSVQAVMGNLEELLSGDLLNETVLTMTSQVGQILELTGNYAEAGKAFTLIENAFQKSSNPALAEQAALRAANGSKRAALVGQPFVVEGVLLDESPFDWSQYAGKVVLVDFWATWCGPCLQEIPNIIAAYEKYKDKGFEVVGVNLDDDVQTVQQFLAPQPLPWTIVVGPTAERRGFENPMADKCGVDAIPFLVLVDQQGNACALHVRGEKLEEKLAELLGPVEEPVQPAPSVEAIPAAPTVPAAPVVPQ
jgi:thiol-disulfide isomerase/thioredoxin